MDSRSQRTIFRGLVVSTFALLLPFAASGQQHQTGLAITKSCPAQVAPGSTFTCSYTVRNLDGLHGVKNLTVTNQVPFPSGPTVPVDCLLGGVPTTTLGLAGNVNDTCGNDITETAPGCTGSNQFVTDKVSAAGEDAGVAGLPVTGTTTNAARVFACTPTNTPTNTPTPTPTNTPTDTPTNTPTNTPTPPPANGQVAPTSTTCSDFQSGTAADLTMVLYGVKNGRINNVAPGVLFYYTRVTAPSSSFTVTIAQTKNSGAVPFFGAQTSQVRVLNSDCSAQAGTVSISGGQVTINVTGATPGEIIVISVKYDPGTVTGTAVSGPPFPTFHYDFATFVNGNQVAVDPDGVDLKPKQ
jgi:hypothetical protein